MVRVLSLTALTLFWLSSSLATAQTPPSATVALDCNSNPETTRIANGTNSLLLLLSLTSLNDPRAGEPFNLNRYALQPGSSVTYNTGTNAAAGSPNTLTRQNIYDNDDSREGVAIIVELNGQRFQLDLTCSTRTRTFNLSQAASAGLVSATATPTSVKAGILPPSTGSAGLR